MKRIAAGIVGLLACALAAALLGWAFAPTPVMRAAADCAQRAPPWGTADCYQPHHRQETP